MSLLKDIFRLFFPPACPVCGDALPEGAAFLCTRCAYDMPLTGFTAKADNHVAERFWGMAPVVNACSMFWFRNRSSYRRLVHAFKYYGGWRLAEKMGEWFGRELDEGGLYGDVDIIIPVPLHLLRRLHRGYNQSEYIAEGISRRLCRPVLRGCVVRRRYNRAQVRKTKEQRWKNVEGIFAVRRPDKLAGKHILLVDDVFTTGATLVSCAEAIARAVPDCRISIATLAVSGAVH